jgi:hypothetical protein
MLYFTNRNYPPNLATKTSNGMSCNKMGYQTRLFINNEVRSPHLIIVVLKGSF